MRLSQEEQPRMGGLGKQPNAKLWRAAEVLQTSPALQNVMLRSYTGWWDMWCRQQEIMGVKREPPPTISEPHRPVAGPWLAQMGHEVPVPESGR